MCVSRLDHDAALLPGARLYAAKVMDIARRI